MTIKEILTESRQTIIGAITWAYESNDNELIKEKMFDFFEYCKAYEKRLLPIKDIHKRRQTLKIMVKEMHELIGNDYGVKAK